ncbi:hypothetical protein SS1G_02535 [Sclerotinia sclerotiorum 1980 UF-70]|uniref:Uncharacterized protein n=2 Tax=Sclerotinia sclerotiorum (strain ATCC 18683 / 1980 / Ss-1) TaxID=665079 RepID=A0A1D9Q1C0_SCLS1|nr:hypothetical protein SS1G_02535 [Sclerotinia sclerotiorum 1980 UF-70]APA08758.1 hypothetical protein sscle_04g035280 [Sclerotinia sclerotiorum 1980 UF-70]EDN99677.1 hypothetical protein SS1G_02535 [Sclerotinia sclerotiorum 1980 UF-70]
MHLVRGLSRRQDGLSTNGTSSTTSSLDHSATSTANSSTDPSSQQPPSDSDTKPAYLIAIISTIVGLLVLLFAIYMIRRTRIKHKNPKYIPTVFLKKKWENWDPQAHQYQLPDQNDPHEYTGAAGVGRSLSNRPSSSFNNAARNADGSAADISAGGVDRNASIRSVMTLPAYNMTPGQNEQVLGREGDRGGIDVVVAFPETIDEEESQREAEMEALYQVRLARRRENEEREERRRLRREARERGDHVALRELQSRPANTATGPTVDELRAEHDRIKRERQRAVSSVAYGDLGVARHDGTRLRANSDERLRANSEESERQGLLHDAASMAASSRYHRRDRSASSVVSIDTVNSDLPSPPQFVRSRTDSRGESPLRRSSGPEDLNDNHEDRAGSSPEMIGHDDIPLSSPPGYENVSLDSPQAEASALPYHMTEPPPDYTSPIYGRGEGPSLESAGSRRSQNMDELMTERRTSTRSINSGLFPRDERRSSTRSTRGVGGIPQLPSLRLGTLPSIHVDPGSPMAMESTEEEVHSPHSQNHTG